MDALGQVLRFEVSFFSFLICYIFAFGRVGSNCLQLLIHVKVFGAILRRELPWDGLVGEVRTGKRNPHRLNLWCLNVDLSRLIVLGFL